MDRVGCVGDMDKTVKLSKRLQMIADWVPSGSRLADIGSDHALLPVYLAQAGKVDYAVAGEVNDGPCQAALVQVRDAGLASKIAVRKGDGLAVVLAGEVDVITIAGMGGTLMTGILSAAPEKLKQVKRLVLQPNVAEDQVRDYLLRENWLLIAEHILEEDGKIYEILVAEQHPEAKESNDQLYQPRPIGRITADRNWLLRLGPYLSQAGGPVFVAKWQGELAKLRMIVGQLASSELESAKEKKRLLLDEMAILTEVLECMQTDRP